MYRLFAICILIAHVAYAARTETLCFGESEKTNVDLTIGMRSIESAERICYSSGWERAEGTTSEATAIVEANGEMLILASGSGVINWMPPSNGVYSLTHRVVSHGVQIGDTLIAVFEWTDDPLPSLDAEATYNDVQAIIAEMSDVRLSEKIGSSAEYAAFRNWVDSSELSHTLVKDAPNAWLSYALDAPALMARNAPLVSEDIVIESMEPSSAATGAFGLVVDIADAEIGEGARLVEALGVEGAAELNESGFSSEGLIVTLERTADGKAKATVTPDGAPTAFFLRVRVK